MPITQANACAPLDAVLVDDVVDHERARLAHDRRFLPGAALDRTHHRTIPGPLLQPHTHAKTTQTEDESRVCENASPKTFKDAHATRFGQ